MTVYVDDAFIQASVAYRGRQIKTRWCHLTADTREELDMFAKTIGLSPNWIQAAGTWREHYDLTERRRAEAVKAGAVEVNWKTHVKNFLIPRRNQK